MKTVYRLMIAILCLYQGVATADAGEQKLPIVYHEQYNFSHGGFLENMLSRLHPFDAQKYRKIAKRLQQDLPVDTAQFYTPSPVSDEDLLLVHSQAYLNSLQRSSTISEIIDMGALLSWVPNGWFQEHLLTPMRYAVGGTVLGAQLALQHGWAINLAGGFHHAKENSGEGGCVFADIPLAIVKLWQTDPTLKVMIVDLDAHQGNGVESILRNEAERVYIFDVFNKNVEHTDDALAQLPHVHALPLNGGRLSSEIFGIPVSDFIREKCVERSVDADGYMLALMDHFPKALAACTEKFGKKPDLIIYNAGTDIHMDDPWGCLNVHSNGIYVRDYYIFQQALEAQIPILMVPSGGYFKDSSQVIAHSIAFVATLKNRVQLAMAYSAV